VLLVVALVITQLDYGNAALAGTSNYLQKRQQSILNAAARLVFGVRLSDRVTPLLFELHWLRIPERIQNELVVLAFRCLHGLAPSYLARDLHRAINNESRRRLWSASNINLIVQRTSRMTIGDRAFPAAAAKVWNILPSAITSASTFPTFRRLLKTELFTRCYSNVNV
jgi:hypothetical protein